VYVYTMHIQYIHTVHSMLTIEEVRGDFTGMQAGAAAATMLS